MHMYIVMQMSQHNYIATMLVYTIAGEHATMQLLYFVYFSCI